MSKKFSLRNILIPVGIFLYIPFSLYIFLIVWGGYYDMVVRGIYINFSNIISVIFGFVIWFLITYFIFYLVEKEYKKDKKFLILVFIPIIFFFFRYSIKIFDFIF